jgi:hypothetical protein
MGKLLNTDQIDQYRKDGAVLIKGKFDKAGLNVLERYF